ncbi:MAG: hypothetical protein ACRYFA_00640 [Janthinobacterium lividum]
MFSFDSTPTEVTTPRFFEAAHMIKRNKIYYLRFFEGKAIDASYQVGYAKGISSTWFFPRTPASCNSKYNFR